MENDIEELLKNLKSNQKKRVRPSIDAQAYLKHVNEGTEIDPLVQLQKEIEKDFGIKMNDEMDLKETEKFEIVEKQLNETIIGQQEYLHHLILGFKRPYVMGRDNEKPLNHILILGKKGSGKHTSLQNIMKFGVEQKIFSNRLIFTIDFKNIKDEKLFYQDFYEASQSNAKVIVFDHLESCPKTMISMMKEFVSTGILRLNKRYAIQKNQLVEANQMLLSQSVSQFTLKNKYCVYISNQSIQSLSNDYGVPFIQSFQDICVTQEITHEVKKEIVEKQCLVFQQDCAKRLNLVIQLDDSFKQHLEQKNVDEMSGYLEKIFDALVTYKLKQEMESGELQLCYHTSLIVEKNNIRQDLFEFVGSVMIHETFEVKKELEAIVGLSRVKEYVLSLEQNVKLQQRRKEQGLKNTSVSMHMIFMGNPGTGKTTIARIISRYLKTMGVIQSGQLVEVTRADLVGQYVGHTAPLTNKIIESALGGVLFIDEAYSLYRGKDDVFGLEAIDTLVKAMEDYRDQLIVILAGYSKEMEDFLEANSGLKSRFPNIIHFEDYTADELVAITQSIAQGKDYRIDEECLEPLHQYYEKMQTLNAKENGNGRLARNCVERAILEQAKRCMKDEKARIDLLKKEDFIF